MGKRKRARPRSLFLTEAAILARQSADYEPPDDAELDELAPGDLVKLAAAGRPGGTPVEWFTVRLTSIDEGVYAGAVACDPRIFSAQRDDLVEFTREQILELGTAP